MATGSTKNPTRSRTKVVAYDDFIDAQLRKVRTNLKLTDISARVMGLTVLVVTFLLAIVIVDHWIADLGVWGRLGSLAALLGGIAFYFVRFLLPEIARKINPAYAAQLVEREEPSLKTSLINFVMLRPKKAELKKVVYDQVEQQAARRLADVNVDLSVDQTPLIRIALCLLGALTLFALYTFFSPKSSFQTIGRVLNPFSNVARPARARIRDVEPGDVQVYAGESLDVSAVIEDIELGDAQLVYGTVDGQLVEQSIEMTTDQIGLRYQAILPEGSGGIDRDMTYEIRAGDAVAGPYRVRVSQAPSIYIEQVQLEFPEYTGLGVSTIEKQGDIDGIEGTKVTITARANHDIRHARIEFNPESMQSGSKRPEADRRLTMKHDGRVATVSFPLLLNEDRRTPQHTSYQLRFTSQGGQVNERPIIYSINVTPDLPPLIEILVPQEQRIAVPENATQQIELRGVDPDFGLSDVRLQVKRGSKKIVDQSILQDPGLGQRLCHFAFSPRKLGLKSKDVVIYRGLARDNRTDPLTGDPAPNEQVTKQYAIVISPPQDPGENGSSQEGLSFEEEGEQSTGDGEGEGAEEDGKGEDGKGEDGKGEDGKGEDGKGEDGAGEDGEGEDGEGDTQADGGGNDEESVEGEGGEGQNGREGAEGEGMNGEESGQSESDAQGGEQQGASNAENEGSEAGPASGDDESSEGNSTAEGNANGNQEPSGGGEPGDSSDDGGSQAAANEDAAHSPENSGGERQGGEPGATADGQPGDESNGEADSESPSDSGQPYDGNASESDESEPIAGDGSEDAEAFDRILEEMKKQNGEQSDGTPNPSQDDSDAHSSESSNQAGENSNSRDPASDAESTSDQPEQGSGGQGNNEPQDERPRGEKAAGDESASRESRESRESSDESDESSLEDRGGEMSDGESESRDQADAQKQGGAETERGEAGEGEKNSGGESQESQGSAEASESPGEEPGASSESGNADGSQKGDRPSPGEAGDQTAAGDASEKDAQSQSSDQSVGEESSPQGGSSQSGQGASESVTQASGEGASAKVGGQSGAGEFEDELSQPGGESAADAANLEYTRKATNLALDHLRDKEHRRAMAEKLGWTPEEMNQFIRRWHQMRKNAAEADAPDVAASQSELNEALRSLGLAPGRDKLRRSGTRVDRNNRVRDAGTRSLPPQEYLEQYEAYLKSVGSVPSD